MAALCGVRREVIYEGQAAIELEAQATIGAGTYPFAIEDGAPARLDVRPLIRAIVTDLHAKVALPEIAGRFHSSIALLLAEACRRARAQTHLNTVALSGGSFQNRLLLEQLTIRLEELGFRVYRNQRVPSNDGGLTWAGCHCICTAAAALNRPEVVSDRGKEAPYVPGNPRPGGGDDG